MVTSDSASLNNNPGISDTGVVIMSYIFFYIYHGLLVNTVQIGKLH